MSPPRAPYALGPFDLLAPAAEGATAVVWRAVHRERRTPLAVKVIRPGAVAEAARAQRLFAHEVRSVARLDHPGIVRIHDFGALPDSADGRLPPGAAYLVMEWISGGTLAGRAGKLDWRSLRATLSALLDALAHAHARGVIHQDLKSANVLCSGRGPVLSDFGIAFSDEQPVVLESGPRFLGTPDYMAPEQILMQRRRIGPWSDLYALGCLAHELVTGRPPFAGRSGFEVLQRHLDEPVPPLPVRDDIPSAFSAWVGRLLAKEPADRFRFAAHAARALRALPGPSSAGVTRARPASARRLLPGTGRPLFALREPPVTGRDAEQVLLRGMLDAVVTERRLRVVLLEGPSDCGQARLAAWLAREAHTGGLADSVRVSGDLAAALAAHLRVGGLEGQALIDLLTERLGDSDAAWGLAAALQPERRFTLDGRAVALGSSREVHRASTRALARLTADGPLVVVVDEGQGDQGQGDEAVRWVRYALTDAPDLALLILMPVAVDRVARAGELDALRAHGRCTRLSIGPLSPAALAASISDRLRLDEGALRLLVERSAGSPVFAEELLEHWLQTDALAQTPTGMTLRAGAARTLPADSAAMWRARLDRQTASLGVAGHRAMEAAATVGARVTRQLWRRVSRLDGAALDATREHLLDARLAVSDPLGGWRFVHPMLRALLLERAAAGGRDRQWHRRCATALMERSADPARIAEHLLAAGDPAEAVPLMFDAVRRAHRRRDNRGMRRTLLRLSRALDAMARPADAPERIELRILWAEANQAEDDPRAARRHVDRAAGQARQRRDPRLLGWALLTRAHLDIRERDTLDRWLRPAWAAARRARDPELTWSAAHALTFMLVKRGRFDEAEAALRSLGRHGAGQSDPIRRGDLHRVQALTARGRGDFVQARVHADAALGLYRRSGSRLKQSHGYNLVGDLARYAADLEAAAEAYGQAVYFGELAGSYDAMTDELNLGLVLLELGRYGEARRRLTAVLQRAERVAFKVLVVYGHLCLLVCEARDGRWSAWDTRWRAIAPVREGKLVDLDVCRVAEMAARHAGLARRIERAQAAWRLAADQYRRLGRDADAIAADIRAEAESIRR